jgi:phage tail sheath gpL-like
VINFPNIPSNLRVPLFYADFDNSLANSGQRTQRTLIIGQKRSTGTAVAGTPIISAGASEAKALGGAGSMLALMVDAYRRSDPFGELWLLPLSDDGSATAATGSVNFTAAATAAGTFYLYIAGQRIAMACTGSQTAAQLATALAAAITAQTDLPVTAEVDGVVTSKVNLTAKNPGADSGDIDVRANYRGNRDGEALPTGMTITITAMSGGATNPSLTTPFTNLADKQFDVIVFPYTDSTSLNAFKTFMSTATGRWSYAKQIYGHGFGAYRGTLSAQASFGAGRNDEHMSILGVYDTPTPTFVVAADMAGVCAASLRADPARPVQTLALTTMLPPPIASRLDMPSRNTLLWSGVSTFSVSDDGTCRLENVITTYQTNGNSQPDDSYLEMETMFQLAYSMQSLRAMITSRFARVKLAADSGQPPLPGSNIVTPKTIRGAVVAHYRELELQGVVQNTPAFRAGLVVEIDAQNPRRVNVLWDGILTNGLRVLAVLNQFRLTA